mmetsp:Transcript_5703/g.9312  ORF Transcript_5703/g.9312 Transcript_5703/m.9312 type:complete len:213 (+) Transcript_5703:595-1233(+)
MFCKSCSMDVCCLWQNSVHAYIISCSTNWKTLTDNQNELLPRNIATNLTCLRSMTCVHQRDSRPLRGTSNYHLHHNMAANVMRVIVGRTLSGIHKFQDGGVSQRRKQRVQLWITKMNTRLNNIWCGQEKIRQHIPVHGLLDEDSRCYFSLECLHVLKREVDVVTFAELLQFMRINGQNIRGIANCRCGCKCFQLVDYGFRSRISQLSHCSVF